MINKEGYDNGLRCKGICGMGSVSCKYSNTCYQYKMLVEKRQSN